VRSSLEELAVRLAVERLGPGWEKVCDGLQDLLDGMRDAVSGGDQVAATEFDIRWHAQLVDAARNRHLSLAWRTVGSPLLIWSPELEDYPLTIEDWTDALDRHEALLAVLRSADLDACVRALRAHILRTGGERDEAP
jgi:Transcriptional regulators